MTVYLFSFCIILLAMSGLGIGLLFGKSGVKSTCNGFSNIVESDQPCGLCGGERKDDNRADQCKK